MKRDEESTYPTKHLLNRIDFENDPLNMQRNSLKVSVSLLTASSSSRAEIFMSSSFKNSGALILCNLNLSVSSKFLLLATTQTINFPKTKLKYIYKHTQKS